MKNPPDNVVLTITVERDAVVVDIIPMGAKCVLVANALTAGWDNIDEVVLKPGSFDETDLHLEAPLDLGTAQDEQEVPLDLSVALGLGGKL